MTRCVIVLLGSIDNLFDLGHSISEGFLPIFFSHALRHDATFSHGLCILLLTNMVPDPTPVGVGTDVRVELYPSSEKLWRRVVSTRLMGRIS